MKSSKTRGQWTGSFGFIMAAIGSAVGLGNLWGFPYKMGSHGGATFLIFYLIVAAIVGVVIMVAELTVGRYSKLSVFRAWDNINKKFAFLGWFGTIVPYLITPFYCVLGGYCLRYMVANLGDVFHASWGVNGAESGTFFGNLLTDIPTSIIYSLVFVLLTGGVVALGVTKGVEKFSKIAIPVLAVLLLVVIIRAVTLPGAGKGIEFMFKPDWSIFADGTWITVLKSAAGQMFFSLSLAMGIMVTFGSYLKKSEKIIKHAWVIVGADTLMAIMAGLAVMPAVFAAGLEPKGGPGLLFISLQTVFSEMGVIGPIFGFILYFLVFIAAITSSISLMEVLTSVHVDRNLRKKRLGKRTQCALLNIVIVGAVATLVAADGLGSNGVWTPFKSLFETAPAWCDCWLDLLDCLSEGLLMPICALCTAIVVGWILGEKFLADEITLNGNRFIGRRIMMLCIKFVAPVILVLVLIGQLSDFGIIHISW